MPDYIVQKAVSPDKVKKKLQRTLAEYGVTYDAFRKYDGCCAVIMGGVTYSRTGEVYQCLDALAEDAALAEFVVIGEAWWPGADQFNLISGAFRRYERNDRLELRVHDVLTYDEFNAGFSPVPFRERMARIPDEGHRWSKATGWAAGTYGCPQAKCNELVELGGYDGLILRDPLGTWTKGSGTTGEIIKIKRVLSFDLRITGCYEGQGKHAGRMGGVYVDFRGKRLAVGTGFSDSERDSWLGACLTNFPDTPIIEVEAMDYSSDGLLREPRFKGIRFDKVQPDS